MILVKRCLFGTAKKNTSLKPHLFEAGGSIAFACKCLDLMESVIDKRMLFLQVYAYCGTLPMPITFHNLACFVKYWLIKHEPPFMLKKITSHNFGFTDPVAGQRTIDVNGRFVSSVSGRRKSSSLKWGVNSNNHIDNGQY